MANTRLFFTHFFFPTYLTLFGVMGYLAIFNLNFSVVGLFFITLLAVFIIDRAEFIAPYSRQWMRKKNSSRLKVDLLHNIISMITMSELIKMLGIGLLREFTGKGYEPLFSEPWGISLLPLPLALLGAILLGDLGFYLSHRLFHGRLLWRFHIVHHSIEQLNWHNAGREHPVVTSIQYASSMMLILFAGGNLDLLLYFSFFTTIMALLHHSNVDMRNGWLNYVLSTNEMHRWHHEIDVFISNHNYGTITVVWDLLLGTYINPERPFDVSRTGVAGVSMRENYLHQLLLPFKNDKTNG